MVVTVVEIASGWAEAQAMAGEGILMKQVKFYGTTASSSLDTCGGI
jgi:hypothetical protein